MIKNTPVKTSYIAPSEPPLCSDLSFQFDFEDASFFFVSEETKPGFFQNLKEKWLDYKGELRLVASAYCLIFTVIALLGANSFDLATPTLRNTNLSITPFSSFSNLYGHFDQKQSSKKSGKALLVSNTVQDETSTTVSPENANTIAVLPTKTSEEEVSAIASPKVEPITDNLDKELEKETGAKEEIKTEKEEVANSISYRNGVKVISQDYQQLLSLIHI